MTPNQIDFTFLINDTLFYINAIRVFANNSVKYCENDEFSRQKCSNLYNGGLKA